MQPDLAPSNSICQELFGNFPMPHLRAAIIDFDNTLTTQDLSFLTADLAGKPVNSLPSANATT